MTIVKLPRRKFLHLAAGAAAVPVVSRIARAQAYPSRPITMIVPFAAGGANDVFARIIAEHMSRTLGQAIVIENVPGAGGTAGSIRNMRANPNGYTIQIGHTGTHASAVSFYPNLAYRPDIDFAFIGVAAISIGMIVARKDFPPKDLNEFVAYLRANADRLNMAHGGVGAASYLFGSLLNRIVGAKPTLVPFNGNGPALNAMIGGQVDYMYAGVAEVVQQVRSGLLKAYGVAGLERNPTLPDVPTTSEAGLSQFQALNWFGLFAPKTTPQPVLDMLTDALDKALDDEKVRSRLSDLGAGIPAKGSRGQQELAELVKADIPRWMELIKGSTAKAE
jgi:tripartite-type tricarboxylate transporter receptor subunit TctC